MIIAPDPSWQSRVDARSKKYFCASTRASNKKNDQNGKIDALFNFAMCLVEFLRVS
jgi:hypothetical protein